MNLWFSELYHILCHVFKLRSTLGKDYEIKSGVYWEQDSDHFAKHMGCKNMWGRNTGNICRVGTCGNSWPNTWERDTLKFLGTTEIAFGKASSRINFQKTHGEQIVNVIGNIMGGTKVLNPTNFKASPVPYQLAHRRWVLRTGGGTTIGGDGQWNCILYLLGEQTLTS
jgi:hypothetical protein